MTDKNESRLVGRRPAMGCLGWFGLGLVWTVSGGVPRTAGLIGSAEAAAVDPASFSFLQMSDSHIGFKAGPYQDVEGTLAQAIAAAKALPVRPKFMLHTGDISHLAKPAQFDTADQINATLGIPVHHVPGEHDFLDPGKKLYLARYGKNTAGDGWYSFDDGGVHFIGLVNVLHNAPDGQWLLGEDQRAWLAADLRGLSASTPIVVFAHVPLWSVYVPWGWGTADAPAALPLFRRFGSVTFLNGHIHQITQKTEGRLKFHTARSTAFPQPAPGTAPHPGPILTMPASEIGAALGITIAQQVQADAPLALTDQPLIA